MRNSQSANAVQLSQEEITVRIAGDPGEKQAVYKFRYEVYVEEMGKPLEAGTAGHRLLYDATDDWSVLLYAQLGSEIIGTLRLAIGHAQDFPSALQDIFSMHQFAELSGPNSKLCLGTKLAVKAEYRGSQVLYALLNKAYEIWRANHVRYTFGGCNPYLIPLYEQMGFRRFANNFTDPGYGMLCPLVMVLEDVDHFRTVRSPFYRMARRYTNDPAYAAKLLGAFPAISQYINSQLITKETIAAIVSSKLLRLPFMSIPLLAGLERQDALSLLALGAIFPCQLQDCLVHQGDISNELYLLLSGSLLAESDANAALIRPGDYFGGSGLQQPQPASETITALTFSEIMVISRQAFERFAHSHPYAAAQILRNMSATKGGL